MQEYSSKPFREAMQDLYHKSKKSQYKAMYDPSIKHTHRCVQ